MISNVEMVIICKKIISHIVAVLFLEKETNMMKKRKMVYALGWSKCLLFLGIDNVKIEMNHY